MIQLPAYYPGLGMIVVAIAFALSWNRLSASLWRIAGLGAIAWILTVALKFAWKTPTNPFIEQWFSDMLGLSTGNFLFQLYRGGLTGLFECALLYLLINRTSIKPFSWTSSVAFGVGFGAVEALGLGVYSMMRSLSSAQPVELSYVLYVSGIRLTVTIAHVFSCVAIVYALATGLSRWLTLSVVFKSLLDGIGALILFGRVFEHTSRSTWVFAWAIFTSLIALLGLTYLHGRCRSDDHIALTAAS